MQTFLVNGSEMLIFFNIDFLKFGTQLFFMLKNRNCFLFRQYFPSNLLRFYLPDL